MHGNWLNVPIRFGTPSAARALTPWYISLSVLDKDWKYSGVTKAEADPYPRVILFKPPTWQKTFSNLRAKVERGVVLWDLHDTNKVPTKDSYSGLVPAGCTVDFVQINVENLGQPELRGVREDESTAGPGKADERSGKSRQDLPTQPGVVARESRLEKASGRDLAIRAD